MLHASTLKFLKDLKKHNNKQWFDSHRAVYDAAREDYVSFIRLLIATHSKHDLSIREQEAKQCVYRINRDVRFSKDKTPYKTNFAASINCGGRKSMTTAGYYFHLEPGKSFAGGGIYMPMPPELKKIRQEIDYNLSDFRKLLSAKKFKSVYGDLDRDKELLLSRVPKGYDPENPAAELLKFKSYIAMFPITDADLTSKDLVKKTVAGFVALQPLIEFINKSLSE